MTRKQAKKMIELFFDYYEDHDIISMREGNDYARALMDTGTSYDDVELLESLIQYAVHSKKTTYEMIYKAFRAAGGVFDDET